MVQLKGMLFVVAFLYFANSSSREGVSTDLPYIQDKILQYHQNGLFMMKISSVYVFKDREEGDPTSTSEFY